MATDSWVSLSFRMGTAPAIRAEKASISRQLASVSNMSSWISSSSVFSLCTSEGTKPFSTMPAAPAGVDRKGHKVLMHLMLLSTLGNWLPRLKFIPLQQSAVGRQRWLWLWKPQTAISASVPQYLLTTFHLFFCLQPVNSLQFSPLYPTVLCPSTLFSVWHIQGEPTNALHPGCSRDFLQWLQLGETQTVLLWSSQYSPLQYSAIQWLLLRDYRIAIVLILPIANSPHHSQMKRCSVKLWNKNLWALIASSNIKLYYFSWERLRFENYSLQ